MNTPSSVPSPTLHSLKLFSWPLIDVNEKILRQKTSNMSWVFGSSSFWLGPEPAVTHTHAYSLLEDRESKIFLGWWEEQLCSSQKMSMAHQLIKKKKHGPGHVRTKKNRTLFFCLFPIFFCKWARLRVTDSWTYAERELIHRNLCSPIHNLTDT